MNRLVDRIVALAVLAGAVSCSSSMKQKELEAVAKDWCMVMRASQVLPVYPLTEDLRPGDVFLVRMPIEDQTALFKERGFLPLDVPVMRLPKVDYRRFYAEGFLESDPAAIPRAAFPTYTFDVKSGGGIKLALPVQGVPVGLSLLKSDAATGSVAIRDALTYGASAKDLLDALDTWAATPKVRAQLIDLARSANQTLFLRVVSRVYLASSVDVSLAASGSTGAKVDAGVPQEIDVAQEPERYADLIKKLNAAVKLAGGAGGSLSVAAASGRTISMNERFERPLVIGYLGFDVPIRRNGDLGPPVSTLDLLRDGGDAEPTSAGVLSDPERQIQFRGREIRELAGADEKEEQARALAIAAYVADGLPAESFAEHAKALHTAEPAGAEDVVAEFWDALVIWVTEDGASGPRYEVAIALYDAAYAPTSKK